MSRCELRGEIGAVGVLVKGGKVIIRESNFKHGGIGILGVGDKHTEISVKNSIFTNCR